MVRKWSALRVALSWLGVGLKVGLRRPTVLEVVEDQGCQRVECSRMLRDSKRIAKSDAKGLRPAPSLVGEEEVFYMDSMT